MTRILLFTVIYLILLSSILNAQQLTILKNIPGLNETRVANEGETVIGTSSGKTQVQVKLRTHTIKKSDENKLYLPDECTYLSQCSLVCSFEIIVNGRSIYVPGSLIHCLAELHRAQIRFETDKLLLVFWAGDASEAYSGQIEFDQGRVRTFRIYADASQKKLLQETTYYVVSDL